VSKGPSRTYRLRDDESPPAGLERIALGRIADAVDELRGKGSDTFADSVHEARKDLKKVRSVLRLVRDELGDEVYRRENERFREAGRLLSGARDAEVKLATIDALRKQDGKMPTKKTLRRYIGSLRAERDEHAAADGHVERAATEIEAAAGAVGDWSLETDSWELVAPGLGRCYRRGRNRFRDTRQDPSVENVHEWRKRVKDLWYHLRILKPIWPELLEETADQAHQLSDRLGDHHDLAVLAEDARSRRDRFDAEADLEALLSAIDRRQGELLDDALAIGARLYAEKPKAFVSRLEGYWSAWRGA
jgi:CHAD domain-containing protein